MVYISLAAPSLSMVLQMQIGQVILMIASPQMVISSSLVRLLSLGNLASNE
jgi:hypothetical protein